MNVPMHQDIFCSINEHRTDLAQTAWLFISFLRGKEMKSHKTFVYLNLK